MSESHPEREIPLNKVPMSWRIFATKDVDESPLVGINIQTSEGDRYYFLDPAVAKQIGDAIVTTSNIDHG